MSFTDGGAPSDARGNQALNQARERISGLINGFSRGQRTTLAVGAVAIVGLILAVSYVQGHGAYAALYTNVSAEDAGVITKKLTDQGVAYKLTGDGSTIEVPADQVYQLRADLASLTLPGSSKVGYGLLDNQSLTTSDFGQRVSYQRALEGEMAKSIQAIQGVDVATVHLAIPADQVFALDSQKTTASVLVKTSGTLAAEQVTAITNLVASGIDGLTADQVSVTDDKGHVLAAPGTGVTGSSGGSDSQSSYETRVSGAIESFLSGSLGAGKAKVTVAADLDFDQKSSTSESYQSPTTVAGSPNPVAQSSSTKTESYGGGAGAAAAGQLGLNGTPATGTTGTGTGYTLDQKAYNYAVDKVVETKNTAPGAVKRLSVAVMVDDKAVSAAQVAQIQTLVSAAAGIDPTRGDTVVVTRMPFDQTIQQQMQKELATKSATTSSSPIMLFAGTGLIALLVVLATFLVMRRRKKDLAQLEELAEQIAEREEWDPGATTTNLVTYAGNDGASADGRFGGSTPASLIGVADPGGPRGDRQAALGDLIDHQPDEVAQLLRDWLGDRRAVRR